MIELGPFAPLLSQLGGAALQYVTTYGAEYIDKLINGNELTLEEKDNFYKLIDEAYRMEKEGEL